MLKACVARSFAKRLTPRLAVADHSEINDAGDSEFANLTTESIGPPLATATKDISGLS